MKAAAEWFCKTVFKEEAIHPKAVNRAEHVPALIRAARSLENSTYQNWQSRESIFMKQGKLLANYEDDYDYRGSVQRYYPTYQALTDQELRGYFSWRTRLRRGDVRQTSLSFAFLYIYELLNQIGVADPMDGYRKLVDFLEVYGQIDVSVLPYLKHWLVDYVVYYGLDAELLPFSLRAAGQSITVLEHIQDEDPVKIMEAVTLLAPKWLKRSKFYAAYSEDMDAVIVRVLRRISTHYATRCKKTMVEQYFGSCRLCQIRIFDAAVFCDPLKTRNYEYIVDEQFVFLCQNGLWSVRTRVYSPAASGKLDDVIKTIDSVMRQEYGYRYPVKAALDAKWILRTIEDEVRALIAEKKAAETKTITINYAQLNRIRQDAAITQEKLVVEDEADAPEEPISEKYAQPPVPEEPAGPEGEPALSREEYRLLQCLLYGGDTGWIQAEGYLLSVLVDGINEKLYDVFLDSVLDDAPQLVEDYIDDLKEMVHP